MKTVQLLKIKAQVSSICAKGCMLMNVCVLSDLTFYPSLVDGENHGILVFICMI